MKKLAVHTNRVVLYWRPATRERGFLSEIFLPLGTNYRPRNHSSESVPIWACRETEPHHCNTKQYHTLIRQLLVQKQPKIWIGSLDIFWLKSINQKQPKISMDRIIGYFLIEIKLPTSWKKSTTRSLGSSSQHCWLLLLPKFLVALLLVDQGHGVWRYKKASSATSGGRT
jgi:hypothetical protein